MYPGLPYGSFLARRPCRPPGGISACRTPIKGTHSQKQLRLLPILRLSPKLLWPKKARVTTKGLGSQKSRQLRASMVTQDLTSMCHSSVWDFLPCLFHCIILLLFHVLILCLQLCWFFRFAEEEFCYCGEDDQMPSSEFSFGLVPLSNYQESFSLILC